MIFIINYFLMIAEGFVLKRRFLKCGKKPFVIITFLQLAAIVSLRKKTVGIDTAMYIQLLEWSKNDIEIYWIEAGSRAYIHLLGNICTTYTEYLAAWAIPTMVLFYRYIIRNSKDIYLSIYIFASLMFYFLEFSLVRQALAIGIVLQAVSLLDERKYFRYILIILIAMSFHSSAAVFFLLLPISFVKCKINLSLSIMIVALCGICAVFGRILTEIGARLIGYSSYLQTEYANAGNVLHPALFLIILMFCTILSMGAKSTKKRKFKIEYEMLAVGVLFYWISLSVQIVNRIPYYFTGSVMTILPNLIVEMKNRKQAKIVNICVIVFLVLYEFLMIAQSAQGIMPYQFFWE